MLERRLSMMGAATALAPGLCWGVLNQPCRQNRQRVGVIRRGAVENDLLCPFSCTVATSQLDATAGHCPLCLTFFPRWMSNL